MHSPKTYDAEIAHDVRHFPNCVYLFGEPAVKYVKSYDLVRYYKFISFSFQTVYVLVINRLLI